MPCPNDFCPSNNAGGTMAGCATCHGGWCEKHDERYEECPCDTTQRNKMKADATRTETEDRVIYKVYMWGKNGKLVEANIRIFDDGHINGDVVDGRKILCTMEAER